MGVLSLVLVLTTSGQSAVGVPPYLVAYSAPSDTQGHLAVFAARADGSDVRQLTSGDVLDFAAGWSPDGRQLAFERVDDSRVYSSVWTVGLDGAPARDLGGGYGENPAWSPDGAWIAFQEQTDYGTGGGRADTTFDLWVSRPDGSSQRQLGSGGTTGSSEDWIGWGLAWRWSPDSRRIAFMQPDPARPGDDFGFRLVVVDVATGRIEARVSLTTDYTLPEPWLGWEWSPDGRRLAFVRPGGRPGTPAVKHYELAVLDLGTGKVRLAAAPLSVRSIRAAGYRSSLLEGGTGWSWSPDGRRIAVVQPDGSRRDPKTRRALLRLDVVNASSGAAWRVPGFLSTATPYGFSLAAEPGGWEWSPDGRRIALTHELSAGSHALVLLVADTARREVRTLGRGGVATWSPDGRRLAVTWEGPKGRCSGIWIVAAVTGSRARIVPPPPQACDDAVTWSPDGSFLAFDRIRMDRESTFTVAPDGSKIQELPHASSSEVDWPPDCSGFFAYGNDWVLSNLRGELRLVARPVFPDEAGASWRC